MFYIEHNVIQFDRNSATIDALENLFSKIFILGV